MLLANLGYLFFLLNAKHIKLCARVLASFTSFFGEGGAAGFLHYGPSLAFPRLLDFCFVLTHLDYTCRITWH
jgi:hypothetical protein